MIGDADRILHEGGVVFGIGVRGRITEILQIEERNLVRVGAQRTQRKPANLLRDKRKRLYPDLVKDVLATEKLREVVADPCASEIAAEFDGVALPFAAKRFRNENLLLVSIARQDARPSHLVEHGADACEHIVGVREALLVIMRELHTQVA